MIRAFIAVEIDAPNKQKLSELISILKKSNADVKWINESQMHLTLKFLGDIEESRVREISDALNSIANISAAFSIRLSDIGAFPNTSKPRVIWLGIDKGTEELKLLAARIETEFEKLGFPKEKRNYKAHLTLGRVRSLKNPALLTKIIEGIRFEVESETKIDKIILFQSTLTPKGAIYMPLAQIKLSYK